LYRCEFEAPECYLKDYKELSDAEDSESDSSENDFVILNDFCEHSE
jgi:hypothetical protein